MNHKSFRFGQWRVDPATNTLNSGELSRQVEPRAMDVLLHLARHPHTVISAETLLDACWGETPASDNAVHKIITQLRRALDDSASDPRYIETIRKRGYRLVAELSYDDDVSQGSWIHASPFRGLEAFEEQHAAIFYGRKLSVDRLVQVVVQQVQAACAMVVVLGPSGAGKTSLIQAGLIPALKAGAAPAEAGIAITDHVQIDCADMGQSGLLETLGSTLLDAEIDGRQLFQNTSAAALANYMAQDLPGLIAHLQAALPSLRLALFIDRFEAIFRLPHVTAGEREVFIDVLDQLARSGCLLLIVACRNDFYPQLTAYPALMNVKLRGGHYDLAPPGSADIAQIVRHPAQAAQLRYTVDEHGEALDDVLCSAARSGPDTLPLLQYCLQELYRQRTDSGELTHAAFHAMGGLEGAIGARAEQVISSLGPAQIAALPQLLSRLVLVAEDDTTVTSRRVPWSDVSNDDETRLVQALVDAHLFVSDLHGGAPAFGIAHEALLRRWPRVVAWVEEHRQSLQTRSRISAQARRWQDSGRKRDMLLPSGTQANQARELVATTTFSFTPEERGFIDQSLAGARRAERLRLGVMIMMTCLALLAIGLGLKARSAQVEAEAHRTEAEGLMGFMLGEFVEKLRPLGKLDLLDTVSTRALSYLSAPGRNGDSKTDLMQRAKSLQIIAEVQLARSDKESAIKSLNTSRAILSKLLEKHHDDAALLKSAGQSAYWLGQIQFDAQDLVGAQRHFEEYREYSDQRARLDPSDVDGWIEQSYAHNNLGSVALRRGDPQRASLEFAHSVQLKTRASQRSPKNKQLISDLADSLSWQASAQVQLGNFDVANNLQQRQLDLLQKLNQADPIATVWIKRLAAARSRRSELKQAQGDSIESYNDAKKAYDLHLNASERDPSNKTWQRLLYLSEMRVLDTSLPKLFNDETLSRWNDLQMRLAQLSAAEPKNKNLQVTIAVIHHRKVQTMLRNRDFKMADRELRLAEEKLQAIRAETASDPMTRGAWFDNLLLRADVNALLGNGTSETCKTLQKTLRPLVADTRDFRLLAPWVKVNTCLATQDEAQSAKDALLAMAYHEPDYLNYLSTHPLKKVSP